MDFIYPYTLEYYNAIIDILGMEGKVTFNKLFEEWVKVLRQTKIKSKKHMKRKHSKPTQYTPSRTQLSDILKKMVADSYLTKLVDEKSNRMLKETKYELTEDARKLLQMNILRIEDKQPIFKRIYEKILFYDFFKRVYTRVLQDLQQPGFLGIAERSMLFPDRTVKEITINSEHEFNNFLSKINIEQEHLNWGITTDGYSSSIAQIIYPHNTPSKCLQKLKKQYWKENDQQLNMHERVYLICFPMNDICNFWIWRVEDWVICRRDKNRCVDFNPKLISRVYHIFIPGVTVEDVLEGNGNNFKKSEVEEAIDILEKSKLIKREVFDVNRFSITDDDLHTFISCVKDLFITEIGLLLSKWELFESPTQEEKKRMEWVLGEKEFKQISTKLEINLSQHKKMMRNCKNVEEYTKRSNEVYLTNWDIRLDKYKEKRKEPISKKENKLDKDQYRKYLKDDLERLIDRSPVNPNYEGIHEIRIAYSRTIREYSFLRDVLKMICPNVMKPIPQDMEKEVESYNLWRKEMEKAYKRHVGKDQIIKIQ
jgi:hypothetical protein